MPFGPFVLIETDQRVKSVARTIDKVWNRDT